MSEAVRVDGDDASRLSRAAALDALEDLQRTKAATEARELRLLARIDELDEAEHPGLRWDRESVSAVLRCAPVTARGRLGQARQLVDTLPDTVAALAAGQLTAMHARALADATAALHVVAVAEVERRVLSRGQTASVAEFRAYCAKTVLAVDPAGAQSRHEQAAADRGVEFRPGADGMGDIRACVTADQMARVRQHLDAYTDTIMAGATVDPADSNDSVDDRSRDAVRADVFCDLLTGGNGGTGGIGGIGAGSSGAATAGGDRPIQVVVPLSTLLNLDDLPGEVDGEPVAASLARDLANDPHAWWRPVLIDRDGHLEAVAARTYRPSAGLARMVQLHDRRCQFPGCRRRAARCEIDHAVAFDHHDPASGGLTTFENLHCLCKRHHRLKHEAGWSVLRKDGATTWRSPQGRRHEKHFDPYLEPAEPDTPVDEPPPF